MPHFCCIRPVLAPQYLCFFTHFAFFSDKGTSIGHKGKNRLNIIRERWGLGL